MLFFSRLFKLHHDAKYPKNNINNLLMLKQKLVKKNKTENHIMNRKNVICRVVR